MRFLNAIDRRGSQTVAPCASQRISESCRVANPGKNAKGDSLTPQEREQALTRLERYTGLDRRFLDHANLRVSLFDFSTELLRDQQRTLGCYDSRLKDTNESGIATNPNYDASYAAIAPPFITLFNQYVRADLGYRSDSPYKEIALMTRKSLSKRKGVA